MYMTRVILRRLPAPNIVHGILSLAFPGKRSEAANENLWRIDHLGNAQALIIVSTDTPDLEQIVSKVGDNNRKPDDEVGARQDKTLDYEPFLERVSNGQIWNFRLCANPVEHIKQSPSDKRGKIYALRTIEDQLAWLDRQSAKYGFVLKDCTVIGDSWIAFGKTRIRAVTFDGVLAVTDANAFRSALTRGIGRGKAYGCGLLTITRVTR